MRFAIFVMSFMCVSLSAVADEFQCKEEAVAAALERAQQPSGPDEVWFEGCSPEPASYEEYLPQGPLDAVRATVSLRCKKGAGFENPWADFHVVFSRGPGCQDPSADLTSYPTHAY